MIIKLFGIVAVVFFAVAQYQGLVSAPPDRMMGDVYRIIFIHVPAAWNALLLFTLSFVSCVAYLVGKKGFWDRLARCQIEVGVVMTGIALVLGSIWGRPTWGVWWTWDPRLTTTILLLILYLGYLILRRLIDDPIQRARVASTVGTFIFLNVPIVYFSVKWWRTLHQVQSTPKSMAPEIFNVLALNGAALFVVCIFLVVIRMRLANKEDQRECGELK